MAPWAKKLAVADAKASFERDFRKRMPGTRYTESAAGVSIDYECTVDEIVVSQTSSKSAFKATVRARLDSYLTMNGPPKHAQDAGTFVFYPTVEEGRWACAPKASNGKATISNVPNFPLALPCMNIATQCLGRHASPAEFDIAMGK